MGEHTVFQYVKKALARRAMGAVIAPLVEWQPLVEPQPGYTVLVGCNRRLGGLLMANLAALARQERGNLREVILVIDGGEEEVGFSVVERAARVAPGLPVRVVHYSERQRSVTRRIDWGWVYAWLSWCVGIAATTTRYAMLHDFDALLLRPDVLEERYREVRARKVEYLGIAYHAGGGTKESDRLCRTFELMFDAQFVRSHNRPIDLFNTMRWMGGRRVEFDTFLNAQFMAGSRDVIALPEADMVHPSQMICQFVDHCQGRGVKPAHNNLLMIPYYEYLGGDGALLADVSGQLEGRAGGRVSLWGKPLDVGAITQDHRAWMLKQAVRMEDSLGGLRPEVRRYFEAIGRV
ncbi:MAG: hypothetical protein U0637_08275 [Phycisphaerales bacterium]